VREFESFLCPYLLSDIEDDLASKISSGIAPGVDRGKWDPSLWQGLRGSCFSFKLDKGLNHRLTKYIRNEVEVTPFKGLGASFHVWEPHSGINWHPDPIYAWGATIYLNKIWKHEYGGIFQWTAGDVNDESSIVHEVLPRYNLMVLNDEQQMHMVTPVSTKAIEYRTTLQLFATKQ
jgi:hypothetical protein|tara:strand:- start:1867 stop:2394 length:528 start_codon:yes stop_codon:yes gene_type:complete